MLISEAFDMYRRDYMEAKAQCRRARETQERVKRTIIETIGDKPIEELTLGDISDWRDRMSLGRCQNTLRNDITQVRSTLKYLRLRGVACLNWELIACPKRIDKETVWATTQEVSSMITHAASLRNQFIISLLYSSGIRVSELTRLDRGQIQGRRFTVRGKGDKVRLCFIDERTDRLMDEYLSTRADNCPALVVSFLYKKRMSVGNVQLIVKNAKRRAGITKPITPHKLRHGFATNMLENNCNLRYCQRMLGHSSIQTTMRYTHVVDLDLEKQYQLHHTI